MAEWQRWKNIMKCYPFDEKRLAKWHPPFIVQPKYDGVRCRAVPLDNGEYLLLSSEENPIFSVPHINKILRHFFHYSASSYRRELDGELYCHGMPFEEIVSITSRTVNLHMNYLAIQFHWFDIIDPSHNQSQRQIEVDRFKGISDIIVVAPFWVCENLDEIIRVYDEILEKGYEGIIVRNAFAPYELKRSPWVMKFKPKQEDIYEIVGIKEEMSKDNLPKNSLGALICRSGNGNTFDVGSGLTDENRRILWDSRDTLVGLNARVKYQHITSGKKVPRFPVFVEITKGA